MYCKNILPTVRNIFLGLLPSQNDIRHQDDIWVIVGDMMNSVGKPFYLRKILKLIIKNFWH